MTVNDHDSLRLSGVSVNVYLKNHMAADPDMAAATQLFRRAAQVVARVEDAIIFNGRGASEGEGAYAAQQGLFRRRWRSAGLTWRARVSERCPYGGLCLTAAKPKRYTGQVKSLGGPMSSSAVVEAVTSWRNPVTYKPFACVLSHEPFNEP